MNVAGLVKSSLIDYPGLIACILFTAGCPYDCFFCHNRAILSTPPIIPEHDIHAFLKKRIGLLDGVVISGGEPTIQTDLIPFCGLVKARGFKIKLDTNGSNPDVVARLIQAHLVDYIAIDYKAPAARYREVCGDKADVWYVHQTIRHVASSDIPYELRTTKIPTLEEHDWATMAEEIRGLIGTPPFWRWNTYRIPEIYKPEDAMRIHHKRPCSCEPTPTPSGVPLAGCQKGEPLFDKTC